MRIRMTKTVMTFFRDVVFEGEEYEATANKHGAICAIDRKGQGVGVKPGEFEFLSAPTWVLDIWKKKHPEMCSNCKIEEDAR